MGPLWRAGLGALMSLLLILPSPALAAQVITAVRAPASRVAVAPVPVLDVSRVTQDVGLLPLSTVLPLEALPLKTPLPKGVVPLPEVAVPVVEVLSQTVEAPQVPSPMGEVRKIASAAAQSREASRPPSFEQAKSDVDRPWSNGPASSGAEPVVAASAKAKPWRPPFISLTLGAALVSAKFTAPVRAMSNWPTVAPYAQAGGIFLGTYAANNIVRQIVTKVADRFHWSPGTLMATRFLLSAGIFAGGGAWGLCVAGVSLKTLLATFGLSSLAMREVDEDIIGNFLECLRVFLVRPFVIGDRIKIGDQIYQVKDFNFRYIELLRSDGATVSQTYAQLAGQAVTVMREYIRKGDLRSQSSQRQLGGLIAALIRDKGFLASTFWATLGMGLAVAVPILPILAPLGFIASWVHWLQAAVVLLAAHALDRGVVKLICAFAQKKGASPQEVALLRLGLHAGIYLLGGVAALAFCGMTVSTALASLGLTSMALGWAAGKVVKNFFAGLWILVGRSFTIGQTIEVSGGSVPVSGVVVEMTLGHVILEHADKSHTLVPYSVVNDSFTKPPVPAGVAQ